VSIASGALEAADRAAAGGSVIRFPDRIGTAGSRRCPSEGDGWIARASSMPSITRPNAAKPCLSGLRVPRKSRLGWSPMQMKKLDRAVRGPARHGQRGLAVHETGLAGSLQGDGGESLALTRRGHAGLHDLDSHAIGRLVAGVHRSVELPRIIVAGIDVAQEVGDRFGCVLGQQFADDVRCAP